MISFLNSIGMINKEESLLYWKNILCTLLKKKNQIFGFWYQLFPTTTVNDNLMSPLDLEVSNFYCILVFPISLEILVSSSLKALNNVICC